MSKNVSRRTFTKGAALAGALAATGGIIVGGFQPAFAEGETDEATKDAAATDGEAPREADPNKQYGFWINTANCVACFDCVKSCALNNGTPWDKDRLDYHVIDNGGQKRHFLSQCQHCDNPACATVCPAHAITKGAGGIVTVDKDRCIGCKYCYHACPFGVPKYLSTGMDKCDYCQNAGVELGQPTKCTQACTHDAMHCGTIEELTALSEGKAKPIDCSTHPNTLFS